jgi:hypothetical protein
LSARFTFFSDWPFFPNRSDRPVFPGRTSLADLTLELLQDARLDLFGRSDHITLGRIGATRHQKQGSNRQNDV